MRVLITGATGFLGRHLVQRLWRERHLISCWVRDPVRARLILGAAPRLVEADAHPEKLRNEVAEADVVIHLAGAPIVGKRWSRRYKQQMTSSRVQLARRLADAMNAKPNPRRVFISASAVGYYGDKRDQWLDEESPAGEGFLAWLCEDWEAAARRAKPESARTVTLRFGMILGRDGGALQPQVRAARLGLLGPLGNGDQFVSWIHIDDLIALILTIMENPKVVGPINGVSPNPVQQSSFAQSVASLVGKQAKLRMPLGLLRVLAGEVATEITKSQRVYPRKALDAGFAFRYAGLDDALRNILHEPAALAGPEHRAPSEPVPANCHSLVLHQHIATPPQELFTFLSHPDNLGVVRAPSAPLKMLRGNSDPIQAGSEVHMRLGWGPFSSRRVLAVRRWESGRRFLLEETQGPFALWQHELTVEATPDGGCALKEQIVYRLPLGPIGAWLHRVALRKIIERAFRSRHATLTRLFGETQQPRP